MKREKPKPLIDHLNETAAKVAMMMGDSRAYSRPDRFVRFMTPFNAYEYHLWLHMKELARTGMRVILERKGDAMLGRKKREKGKCVYIQAQVTVARAGELDGRSFLFIGKGEDHKEAWSKLDGEARDTLGERYGSPEEQLRALRRTVARLRDEVDGLKGKKR